MAEFEIIYVDHANLIDGYELYHSERVHERVHRDSYDQARAYAQDQADFYHTPVAAVLRVPTEQEQRDAVLALWTQFHAVAIERWGQHPDPVTTKRVARAERRRIQQSVTDDEILGLAVSTAYFVGDKARLQWFIDSTPEEA